jgi:hypothetical protein
VDTGNAVLYVVNRRPGISYSKCGVLQNPNPVRVAYVARIDVYDSNGVRYDTVSFPAETRTLGPNGAFTIGCGDPRTTDYSFSHPVATRYVVRVTFGPEDTFDPQDPEAMAVTGQAAVEQRFTALPPRLIVSEFRTRGPNGPEDQFVELYNDSLTPADLRGVAVFGGNRQSNSTDGVTLRGGTLGPGCHYLLTGPAYSGYVPGDATMTAFLRDDGNIRLRSGNSQYEVGDLIGMDGSWQYYEGTPLAPFGASNTDRSYRRVGPDTDDNARDFRMVGPATPQNSTSCGGL